MVQNLLTKMSQLKKYFQKKNLTVRRIYVSYKLYRVIILSKKMMEERYKKKYGKRKTLTFQSASEAVGDRCMEVIQSGKW